MLPLWHEQVTLKYLWSPCLWECSPSKSFSTFLPSYFPSFNLSQTRKQNTIWWTKWIWSHPKFIKTWGWHSSNYCTWKWEVLFWYVQSYWQVKTLNSNEHWKKKSLWTNVDKFTEAFCSVVLHVLFEIKTLQQGVNSQHFLCISPMYIHFHFCIIILVIHFKSIIEIQDMLMGSLQVATANFWVNFPQESIWNP